MQAVSRAKPKDEISDFLIWEIIECNLKLLLSPCSVENTLDFTFMIKKASGTQETNWWVPWCHIFNTGACQLSCIRFLLAELVIKDVIIR